MRELGARDGSLCAKIAGGASMFTSLLQAGGLQIGQRNLIATRAALAHARIPIVGEDVGGAHGRSVYFHVATGEVVVKSVVNGNVVL
jgi:chemotaxis protein CheD